MVTYHYEFEELPIYSHIPSMAVACVSGSADVDVHSDKVQSARIALDDLHSPFLRIELLPKTPLHDMLLTSLQRAYEVGQFGPAQEPRTGHDENDEHRLTGSMVV